MTEWDWNLVLTIALGFVIFAGSGAILVIGGCAKEDPMIVGSPTAQS